MGGVEAVLHIARCFFFSLPESIKLLYSGGKKNTSEYTKKREVESANTVHQRTQALPQREKKKKLQPSLVKGRSSVRNKAHFTQTMCTALYWEGRGRFFFG